MEIKTINQTIIKILAEQLGVEPEDIKEDDSLVNDLHMKASDLTDFVQKLQGLGFEISETDLEEIETVEELIETLNVEDLTDTDL